MKKRLPLLILALLSLVTAKAEVISQDAARQKAMNFLTNRLHIGKRVAVRGVHEQLMAAESCDTYHIFNIGDADGYVVVSGDDVMPDILGYSDNGRFDTKKMPDNMRALLQGYEKQYEYLETIEGLGNLNTTYVTDMSNMFNSPYRDHTYARLDGGESAPGYFTSINDQISLELQYEGKTLEDNSTVVIEAKKDDWGFGGYNCETNPINNPLNGLIVVTSKGGQDGTAKMEILSNTLNPGIVQWCMGSTCASLNGKSSFEKSFTTDDNGIAQVQFDANNIKSAGSLEARLTITIGSHVQIVNIIFVNNSDEHDVPGDVNGDGTVDKADIVEIENYIMGRPSDSFNKVAADMNNDGVINVADIVEIVNNIKFK